MIQEEIQGKQTGIKADIRQRPNSARVMRMLREMSVWSDPRGADSRRSQQLLIVLVGVVAAGWLGSLEWPTDRGVMAQTVAPSAPVTAFIAHPLHCAHLLGDDLEGDVPPPVFHVALAAVLDANGMLAERAIAELNARCRRRLGRSGW